MGTKNNPGQFDCYARAEPDEPVFVLLGRDRVAAYLVEWWAALRQALGEDGEQIDEARQCAAAMRAWCEKLGKEPFTGATAQRFKPDAPGVSAGRDIRDWQALAHAMQTGVAIKMQHDPSETTPKHLRVGVNAAMSVHAGLVRVLIAKGVLSEAEYIEAITAQMRQEVESYERWIRENLKTTAVRLG